MTCYRGNESFVFSCAASKRQIGAGQLSKRISASTGEDEFTLLNRDVNAMLDRIELLMKSARHISDTIAHNLRTPLTRIVGALRTARRPGVSMAEVLDANQHAIESIERLNVLLEKLLQIAELEAGIQRRSFRPCELDVIVADVLEMYGTLAEEKGVSLLRAKLDNVTLHGDANLLASALANLIDNAVKFAASRVVVDVTRQNRTALVTITDDGAGPHPPSMSIWASILSLGSILGRPWPGLDQRQEHRRPACRHAWFFRCPTRAAGNRVAAAGPKVKALRLAQHGSQAQGVMTG